MNFSRTTLVYLVYIFVGIIFIVFPQEITKYIPSKVVYTIGFLSLVIVSIFYVMARLKNFERK
ncbi:MAG TPA: hypothetical protein PKD85_13440, partial [Saprospiraceae bacterium]|nr:hypothetical protein [Saprospiraceae bacterium]